MINPTLKKDIQTKMTSMNMSDLAQKTYLSDIQRYVDGDHGIFQWQDVEAVEMSAFEHYETLPVPDADEGKRLCRHSAIGKLNGGLGTSMGCSGAKSLLSVRENRTFLDHCLDQIQHVNHRYDCHLPLVLMNSFNTSNDTRSVLDGNYPFLEMIQHQFPRLNQDFTLFSCPSDDTKTWYPPGHGDIYSTLVESGVLDRLLENDIFYLFLSNSDNVGALFDPRFPAFMEETGAAFVMEIAEKTAADVKGGTLVHYLGRLELMERAQVDPWFVSDFENVSTFSVFNTNNIWIDLRVLKTKIMKGMFTLPLIVNRKVVDGTPIIQLETAMGAAMGCFESARGIVVPRRRFLPVKKTNDLVVLQSDFIVWNDDGSLDFNSDHGIQHYPQISFSEHYATVTDFLSRFPSIPSLKGCHSLSIDGDITFGQNVVISGDVELFSKTPVCVNNCTFSNGRYTL